MQWPPAAFRLSLPSPRGSESIGLLPASKFDEKLTLDAKSPVFEDLGSAIRHGPCAMGDVGTGDKLTSLHVLLIQHTGGRSARATGVSGRLIRSDRGPKGPKRWMVNTELEKGSRQFVVGKPAMAMAMAIVKHGNGGTEIERWSQAVSIVRSG